MPHSIPFLLTLGETFDVGVDTRTPVDDTDYEVPFRFSGKIAKLTIKLGPEQLVEDDRRQMQEAINRVND
jgi:arylsulfatase